MQSPLQSGEGLCLHVGSPCTHDAVCQVLHPEKGQNGLLSLWGVMKAQVSLKILYLLGVWVLPPFLHPQNVVVVPGLEPWGLSHGPQVLVLEPHRALQVFLLSTSLGTGWCRGSTPCVCLHCCCYLPFQNPAPDTHWTHRETPQGSYLKWEKQSVKKANTEFVMLNKNFQCFTV